MFICLGLIILFFGAFFLISETDIWNKSFINRPDESPLEIVKKKYAGGEINREEFMKKKKDLIS